METLLEKGACPDATDSRGSPAILRALSLGDMHSVQALLQHNAKTDRTTCTSRDGCTVLALAVISGNPDIVQVLINKGHNISQTNPDELPILIAATAKGHFEIVELLCARNKVDIVCHSVHVPGESTQGNHSLWRIFFSKSLKNDRFRVILVIFHDFSCRVDTRAKKWRRKKFFLS